MVADDVAKVDMTELGREVMACTIGEAPCSGVNRVMRNSLESMLPSGH